MLLSTLPDLPGQIYHPLTVVCVSFGASETRNAQTAIAEIEQQADAVHADAVINIQVITPHHTFNDATALMIGTAVKIDPVRVSTT